MKETAAIKREISVKVCIGSAIRARKTPRPGLFRCLSTLTELSGHLDHPIIQQLVALEYSSLWYQLSMRAARGVNP
jgi:hypothetical protein